jgi:hypothetical protein
VASYSFHRLGDPVTGAYEDWSYRADLTFILVLLGALPFFAANGLWRALNGTPALPRDLGALLAKFGAIVFGSFSFAYMEEIYGIGTVLGLGSATVGFNFVALCIMARRAAAMVKVKYREGREWRDLIDKHRKKLRGRKETPSSSCWERTNTCWEDWIHREGTFNPDKIEWGAWDWTPPHKNAFCQRVKDETRTGLKLAGTRFVLGLLTIAAAAWINCKADEARKRGWGNDGGKNLTAQYEHDIDMTQVEIADAIEARKRYDYMHAMWHLLSAMFLMNQAVVIMEASNGRIEHLDRYFWPEEKKAMIVASVVVAATFCVCFVADKVPLSDNLSDWFFWVLFVFAFLPGPFYTGWLSRRAWGRSKQEARCRRGTEIAIARDFHDHLRQVAFKRGLLAKMKETWDKMKETWEEIEPGSHDGRCVTKAASVDWSLVSIVLKPADRHNKFMAEAYFKSDASSLFGILESGIDDDDAAKIANNIMDRASDNFVEIQNGRTKFEIREAKFKIRIASVPQTARTPPPRIEFIVDGDVGRIASDALSDDCLQRAVSPVPGAVSIHDRSDATGLASGDQTSV